MSALDLYQDQVARTEIYDAIVSVSDKCDLLIVPTFSSGRQCKVTATPKGPKEINGEPVDPLIGWCLTYLMNFTGHPAISIPAGRSSDSLRIGMQIIGRRYGAADVLAASAAFERLRPWADTYRIGAGRSL